MKIITKSKVYKTADGRIFDSKDGAERWNNILKLKDAFKGSFVQVDIEFNILVSWLGEDENLKSMEKLIGLMK